MPPCLKKHTRPPTHPPQRYTHPCQPCLKACVAMGTVCPSLRDPHRAEWRETNLFFSANEMPNYYSISAAPTPTQVSPIAQGSQQEQSSSDISADIPHFQGDFVLNQAPSIKNAAPSIKKPQSSPLGCFEVRPST